MSSRPDWFTPAAGAVGETGDMLTQGAADAQKHLDWTIEHKDGVQTASLEMDMETFKQFQQEREQLQKIKESYNNEAQRLEQREQQTRAHPIANLLSNVAGAMAQDPKMPGWVHALGKTSLQLNPTADALAERRMGVQGGIADILKQEAGLTGEMAAVGARTASARLAGQREQRLAIGQVGTSLVTMAKDGPVDPKLAESMYLQAGATPEQAHAAATTVAQASQELADWKAAGELAKEKRSSAEIASKEKIAEDRISAMHRDVMEKIDAAKEKPTSVADKPLGENATKWENSAGERPSALSTMKEAVEAGFKPVGKASTADTRRASMALMDQLFDLIPKLEKKGFLSTGTGIASTTVAGAKRTLEPGDPDLAAWKAHAGTMVSLLRQLGDIGPRAISAYQSAIAIVEHPTSAAAAKQALTNLRDAIKAGSTAQGQKADKDLQSFIDTKVPKDGKLYPVKTPDGKTIYVRDGQVVK